MSHAGSQPNSKADDVMGTPFVCVRLAEPFEQIIAKNPELIIEQTATGEIVFMPPTGGESGRSNSELCFQVQSWAKRHGGYCFDSSTLFCLPNGAKRSPDASWIAPERWKQLSKRDRESYPPICPDVVVELRSKTDRLQDLQDKMNEYVNNGARLGWLIDPIYRAVYVYKPNIDVVCLQDCRQVSDDAILPGFVLDLTAIWPDSN
ncbi:MAG TPA: Uma2 family endonuclease [Pirellula sp.]|nr:Uma2 family endonuclease [Pirellula sp.]